MVPATPLRATVDPALPSRGQEALLVRPVVMHAGYVAICSHLFAFLFRPWRDKPCPAALWEIYMAEIRNRQDKES